MFNLYLFTNEHTKKYIFLQKEWLQLHFKQGFSHSFCGSGFCRLIFIFILLWLLHISLVYSPNAYSYISKFENYLNILEDKDKITLCRFRTTNHRLPVEVGKWKQIIRDDHLTWKGGGGGLWFFVSFRKKISDNTRDRIFIYFVAQSAKFLSRIQHHVI